MKKTYKTMRGWAIVKAPRLYGIGEVWLDLMFHTMSRLTPTQARRIAAALLKAADEAEKAGGK